MILKKDPITGKEVLECETQEELAAAFKEALRRKAERMGIKGLVERQMEAARRFRQMEMLAHHKGTMH